ncbi:hypothetical protein GCM10010407_05140 [Rarobacter incanus]
MLSACSAGGGAEATYATAMPTAAGTVLEGKDNTYDPVAVANNMGIQLSEQQLEALADGEVTYDEYQEAAQRMKACADAAGVKFEFMGEENQVIQYQVEAGDEAFDKKFNNCYDTQFAALDDLWQGYRMNWGPEAAVLADCIRAKGEEPRLLIMEKIEQLEQLGMDPQSECIDPKLNQGPNATANP